MIEKKEPLTQRHQAFNNARIVSLAGALSTQRKASHAKAQWNTDETDDADFHGWFLFYHKTQRGVAHGPCGQSFGHFSRRCAGCAMKSDSRKGAGKGISRQGAKTQRKAQGI